MSATELRPLAWRGDAKSGRLALLDQRLLPGTVAWREFQDVEAVAGAIRDMTVRGAPAIGLTAAYGMVLAAQEATKKAYGQQLRAELLRRAKALLAATRPTAVNLFWALEEMDGAVRSGASDEALLEKALALHEADVAGNARIGEQLLARLSSGMNVLTHCNAGALATGGLGTALAGLFLAQQKGLSIHVWVSETRPRLQGARLTAFELTQANVPCTLITDNMAASLMAKGKVDLVVTGADRVAKNGDVANKIGTSMHAVCAKHFGVPFHVAAPRSTFDPKTKSGQDIVIEEREPDEVTTVNGERLCPVGMKVYNPSFDVTPAGLIRSLFTDQGEVEPVTEARLAQVLLSGGPR